MSELGLLRQQIQTINRTDAQQPPNVELTGDKVLANIIAPPRSGGAK